MRPIAEKMAKRTGNMYFFEVQTEIADYMLKEKRLYPNVDYYTALIYHCVGLKKDVFTTIFAACRTAGWLAHVMEQRREKTLIRPCSEYVGPDERHYLPDVND